MPAPPERVRIGAVAYLNARPLVYGLERGLGGERIELSYAVPALLADQLRDAAVDVALLPIIELARLPGLELLPGLGIVTCGRSRSVLLVTRRPLGEIRSVALDPDSRTSNTLAQVLFAEVWQSRPEFACGPAALDDALEQYDAVVRIGDKALFEPLPDGVFVHDLGEVWTARTGLPFVFAGWAARAGVVDRDLYRLLHDSRRAGSRAVREIAEEYVWNGVRNPPLALAYLTENIRFRLGAAELQAVRTFFHAAHAHGLIDGVPEIRLALQRRTACHEAAEQISLRGQLDAIGGKAAAGQRIAPAEALLLLRQERLTTLGALADLVRRKKHPQRVVSYIIDRNVNYTNVCNAFCSFCAFFRPPNHEEGYVLPVAEIERKIRETYALGGNQILLQGGHNPKLKIDYYEDLFRRLKAAFPDLWLHALSPPEVIHIRNASRLTLEETLRRLMDAGLDSLPGGGAEILVDRVREQLATNKCSAGEWLAVMEQAHRLGLRSTATMMFGHVETLLERIEHLERLRELQDRTAGFTAFIGWTYQAQNTALGGSEVTSAEYLRTLAVARVFLDNFSNFQASWVTQGPKMGAASLAFGVNDMGSTMIEENVVSAAGTVHSMNEPEIVRAIRDAGFVPKRRDMTYERLTDPVHA